MLRMKMCRCGRTVPQSLSRPAGSFFFLNERLYPRSSPRPQLHFPQPGESAKEMHHILRLYNTYSCNNNFLLFYTTHLNQHGSYLETVAQKMAQVYRQKYVIFKIMNTITPLLISIDHATSVALFAVH